MNAVIWTAYGPPDVLQLQEVPTPAPQANEVRVRIHAASVLTGDCEMRALKLPLMIAAPMRAYIGFTKPTRIRILGQEFAGEIESVGASVTRFKPGDPVYGTTGLHLGCHAEYVCLPAQATGTAIAFKPKDLTYEQAAAVPVGGLEALHFIGQANIQPGEQVLIVGAGGSIGTLGVQLAKHHGATITAVDSAGKLDLLRALGADRVIDYAREDFTADGAIYDVIYDIVGKRSLSDSLRALKRGGRYLLGNPGASQMFRGPRSTRDGKRIISGGADYSANRLDALRDLLESGTLQPVIDRTYPLAQTADAHRYVETGEKKGSVLIEIA